MNEGAPASGSRGTLIARVVAVVAVIVFLALVATLSRPQASRATTPQADEYTDLNTTRLRAARTPAFLGSLEGQGRTIEVYMTRSGVRYTVLDEAGKAVAEHVTIERLQGLFPELDFSTMHASSETQSASAPVDR